MKQQLHMTIQMPPNRPFPGLTTRTSMAPAFMYRWHNVRIHGKREAVSVEVVAEVAAAVVTGTVEADLVVMVEAEMMTDVAHLIQVKTLHIIKRIN